ncbi:MAG: BamA/TamA family outer membrane protein [Bacteroidota bacterium]
MDRRAREVTMEMILGAIRRAGRFFLVVGMLIPATLDGQQVYFGKNKVQYQPFKWSFIQSDHFDIYFSQDGQYLAEFTAVAAESAYASISKLFRYQLVNRVPLIIYNSHNDFQQTNVVNTYLEEGIGGVTELFKNRVVMPFEGEYKKFRHVIHHELVHAVINDMFYGGSIQSIISNNITLQIPLWFNEGLAEFEALRWDTNSDMFLRDATVHEKLPEIERLNGYFAYRGGQSVFWYIARKYGEQKIGEIINRIKSTRSVQGGFRGSIGLTVEELSERWHKDQKVQYWPDIAKREDPADFSRRLTDHQKEGGFYNTSPTISPQGDRIAFISNRDDFFDLFIMNASDGSRLEKLIDGQQTENLEELHLLTPGLSWSPDGKRLALAAKAGEQDAILLFDVDDLDNEKLTFGLEGIFSVAWSPSGDRIAFVGNDHKQSDVYVYDFASQGLANLTSDVFSDSEPAWSPDGKRLVFASDRGAVLREEGTVAMDSVDYQQKDLYLLNVETQEITRLTDWPRSDEMSPVVGPDGNSVLFISDRNGINNVYTIDLDTREWRPVTNSIAGVYQLSLSRDGSKMAFTSLSYSGFDIFVMRSPLQRELGIEELELTEFFKLEHGQPVAAREPSATIAEEAVQEDTSSAVEGLYGDNIEIDFSNYVFEDTHNEAVPTDSTIERMAQISGNVDEEGKYKVNKYKLNFSPDIVYGAAGYDTFYGISGSTVMAFSDMLGDHQIVFVTNLLLDLKNSDYGLQYFYLGGRIDWGIGGFHSARFVFLRDAFGESLYRFRTYGGTVAAYYPIDRFARFEYDLTWYSVSKENLDRIEAPIQQRNLLVPGFAYVYDTVLWGFTAPVTGSRYRFHVFGTPKLGRDGLSFVNVTADYRTYLRLGRNYSVALRLAGGGSFGTDPQKFVVGGVDYWINPSFEGGYIPLEGAEDYLFLQTGLPLRGYNYNARIGSRYFIYNMEFRYPLFAFLQAGPLPIGLQSLGGAIFFDMGSAWNSKQGFVPFTRNSTGKLVTRDLLMGMGTGARIFFLMFLLRLDVAWAWDLDRWSTPKYYFSLGADF